MDYIFEKGKFTEDELEHAIIELFQMQGYEYTYGEDIHRRFEDILLEDDLCTFLNRKYSDKNLSDVEMKKIITMLTLIPSTPLYYSNRQAF